MFGRSRKRKRKHLAHPVLGNLKYYEGWAWLPQSPLVKMKVPLWGKVYGVTPLFTAKNASQKPTPLQEEAYGKFEKLVIEKTDLIEQLILEHYKNALAENVVPADTIVPTAVLFGRSGECLLEIRDRGVFRGFSVFLAPKMFLCETWAATCYLNENPKAADSARQIRAKLFGEDGVEAEVHRIKQEIRRTKTETGSTVEAAHSTMPESRLPEDENQYWIKYAQALLDYEREQAERNRLLLEQYDSIKMPRLPLGKTLLGAGITAVCTLALIWMGSRVVSLDFEVMNPIEQLLIVLASIFLWFIFAAGWFFTACDEWSDYLSARRDFDTYRWEKMERENNPGG